MRAFWDVLFADFVSLAKLVGLALVVTLPTAGLGAIIRCYFQKPIPGQVVKQAVLRGAILALLAAIAAGMFVANWVVLLIFAGTMGAIASFAVAHMRLQGQSRPGPRRLRFTVRHLLLWQAVVALLIVWWLATRQQRIEQQRLTLDWQRRQAEAESVFQPYWFRVQASQTGNSIRLLSPANLPRPGWNDNQPVDDETIRLLARHKNVTTIDVASNSISDEGLAHLASASRLKEVNIKSIQITNAGVESLCALPSIETLGIDSPRITPAVLKHLAKVKSLKVLQIGNSTIQEADAAEFRDARPDVNLSIWQWSPPGAPPPPSAQP
jgi:hypothetical protein